MTSTLAFRSATPGRVAAAILDLLDGTASAAQIGRFLRDTAPGLVVETAAARLRTSHGPRPLRLVRSRLKPGRSLQAYFLLDQPGTPVRGVAATWRPTGLTVQVAPEDPAFPQLPRLYDARHVARQLSILAGAPTPEPVTIVPIRYRPGQRHVLRMDLADGRRYYVKTYADGAGAAVVEHAARIGHRLTGPATGTAATCLGYAASDRAVWWRDTGGIALSAVISSVVISSALISSAVVCDETDATGLHDALVQVGTGLRAIHDSPALTGSSTEADVAREAATTRRAVVHLTALHPAAADQVERRLDATLAELLEAGEQPTTLLHGDVKADNLMVTPAGLRWLDLDRVRGGDPALDLGKLCSDLRWWAASADRDAEPLLHALHAAYAPDPARWQRAHAYAVLFSLRAVGRRIPLHAPDWSARVDAALAAVGGAVS